jgi:cytochrome c-type biogenesis protein CcmE
VSSQMKFVIGGLVVVIVVVALIATSFSGSNSEYLTIGEVKALGPDQTQNSRVAGKIVSDSVEWDTAAFHLAFEIEDETGRLPISYSGPKPDMMADAVEAVAIGKYDPVNQVFTADELLMKCPSKYEEKQ